MLITSWRIEGGQARKVGKDQGLLRRPWTLGGPREAPTVFKTGKDCYLISVMGTEVFKES